MSRWVRGGLILLGALGSSGCCGGPYDMEKDEPCRQAGYAIASRTFACTGDGKLANERYLAFQKDFTCKAESLSANSFRCVKNLNDLSCESVALHGDRLEAWVGSSHECMSLVGSSTRTIRPAPPGDLARDPDCWRFVQQAAMRRSSCTGESYGDALSWMIPLMDSKFTCYDKFPSAFGREADLAGCRQAIQGMACEALKNDTLELGVSCDYVLSPR